MRKTLIASLFALAALGRAFAAEIDYENGYAAPDFHLWVNPMVGPAGPGAGVGIGLNASQRNYMASARTIAATAVCIMDCVSDHMFQHQFLLGWKKEGAVGYVALLSGLSRETGGRKEVYRDASGFVYHGEYHSVPYSGFGLPIVVDMNFANRIIGIGLSAMVNLKGSYTNGGLMLSIPFGNIRR